MGLMLELRGGRAPQGCNWTGDGVAKSDNEHEMKNTNPAMPFPRRRRDCLYRMHRRISANHLLEHKLAVDEINLSSHPVLLRINGLTHSSPCDKNRCHSLPRINKQVAVIVANHGDFSTSACGISLTGVAAIATPSSGLQAHFSACSCR
jgi:hypothetical protein